MKDEVNRQKEEKGKPDIPENTQKETTEQSVSEEDTSDSAYQSEGSSDAVDTSKPDDISSKQERNKEVTKRKKKRKKKQVKFDKSRRIDKQIIVDLEGRTGLADDLEFKGFATSHYQDLEIKTYITFGNWENRLSR